MENHRFTGGFKLPINFSGSTYFLQYENFERRVDWGILFLRDVNTNSYAIQLTDPTTHLPIGTLPNPYLGKTTSNLLQGSASYPLDRRRSIRLHLALRQDILDFKATDSIGLKYLDRDKQYWTMSRAEYVHDNTTNPALNIWKGMRYKFFAEYFYKLSAPNGGFFNVGLDARYYKPLYKNIIFAGRVAYAHSGGNQQVNYVLGGVDNWLMPKQSTVQPPSSQNFAFQALATNLRGYPQNARRGNSFGVINAEVRAPILTSFLKRPIQSAFLKNLQLVGFIDAGSAWNGWKPMSADEPDYNFPTSQQTPAVIVSLPAPDYSVAVGYGAGLRTMLFGYFMRLDAAWNIEQTTAKPMFIFSIGTDF
jgi:outer membrane protein assembly factor BamA